MTLFPICVTSKLVFTTCIGRKYPYNNLLSIIWSWKDTRVAFICQPIHWRLSRSNHTWRCMHGSILCRLTDLESTWCLKLIYGGFDQMIMFWRINIKTQVLRSLFCDTWVPISFVWFILAITLFIIYYSWFKFSFLLFHWLC